MKLIEKITRHKIVSVFLAIFIIYTLALIHKTTGYSVKPSPTTSFISSYIGISLIFVLLFIIYLVYKN